TRNLERAFDRFLPGRKVKVEEFLKDFARLAFSETLSGMFGSAKEGTGLLGTIGRSLFGSFAGGFAQGGLIPSGSWGIVGENGPEPAFATAGGAMVLPSSGRHAGPPV